MKGFSPRNLKYMRAFAEAWLDEQIVQQLVAQIPWGHNVRQRGFEPLQQEQMVLQYVDKFGRITLAETCNLCQVGPYQAYRVIRNLVEKGFLIAKGQKRARHYERHT